MKSGARAEDVSFDDPGTRNEGTRSHFMPGHEGSRVLTKETPMHIEMTASPSVKPRVHQQIQASFASLQDSGIIGHRIMVGASTTRNVMQKVPEGMTILEADPQQLAAIALQSPAAQRVAAV